MSAPVIRTADQDHCLASWRNVVIFIRRGRSTIANSHRSGAVGRELLKLYPEGVGFFLLIEATATLPDRTTRIASVEVIRALKKDVLIAAIVMEAKDTISKLLRTIIRSVSAVLASDSSTGQIFQSVREAAQVMAPRLGTSQGSPVSGSDLVAAVNSVREEYNCRVPAPQA